MSRQFLIGIYKETRNNAPEYKGQTRRLSLLLKIDEPKKRGECIISVENIDTLNFAEKLVQEGYNPLVLNMASFQSKGGGVENGAIAQEENLFRRSNYYKAIPDSFYPLHKEDMILSTDVTVFRNDFYEYIKNPFDVDMIAMAAIKNPKLKEDDTYFNEDDHELMDAKIKSIFLCALYNKNDSVLLSALGCGAYHNNPYIVAKIFKKYVDKYKPYFRFIAFGILGINENYSVFRKIISGED